MIFRTRHSAFKETSHLVDINIDYKLNAPQHKSIDVDEAINQLMRNML